MLEDPKDREELDRLFDRAYSMLAMTQQVERSIRSHLHLTYSKLFPNGVLIVSTNRAMNWVKKRCRPRRATKEKENQMRNQHDMEPMQIHIPPLEASDTQCTQSQYSVVQSIVRSPEGAQWREWGVIGYRMVESGIWK